MSVTIVYLCGICNKAHDVKPSAQSCCTDEIETAWKCPACKGIWYRKQDADACQDRCAADALAWKKAEEEHCQEAWEAMRGTK